MSGDLYADGSLEIDVLAGYAKTVKKVSYDVGLVRYFYPGAKTATATEERYDTTEFFLGAKVGPASFKYSRTLSDWFGVCDGNPFNLPGLPNGSSRGSGYLELRYAFQLEKDLSLTLRAGHQNVKNYGDASYTDYGLKIAKALRHDVEIALIVSNSDADETLYSVAGDDLGGSQVALLVSRNF